MIRRQHALWITMWTNAGKRRRSCEQPGESPVHFVRIVKRKDNLTRLFIIHTVCVETAFNCRLRLVDALPRAVDEHADSDLTTSTKKR